MSEKERLVLRQEAGGDGYLFNRETGQASHVLPGEMEFYRAKKDVNSLPVLENFPEHARAAPFFSWMQLTHDCPISCRICGAFSKGPEMSVNQWANTFDDMHQAGVFEARMTGGEPTRYPGFEEVVHAAHEAGMYVSASSCGIMDSELRKRLPKLPIGLFVLSIDGPPEIHDHIRGKDAFSQVQETLNVLTDAGKRVRVNSVLFQANKNHLVEMGQMFKQAGVEGWTLIPLRPIGRALQNYNNMRLSRLEYGQALTTVRQLRDDLEMDIATSYDTMSQGRIFNTGEHFTKRCAAGIEVVNVNPVAKTSACILHAAPEFHTGDLQEEPFREIWADDSRWKEFRSEERLSQACRECDHFGTDCAGTCLVIARHEGFPDKDIYCQIE